MRSDEFSVDDCAHVSVALRDAARPTYWEADDFITDCSVCAKPFGPLLKLHHCRACGKGVCAACSPQSRPVPSRGWDHPVRVCSSCYHKPDGWPSFQSSRLGMWRSQPKSASIRCRYMQNPSDADTDLLLDHDSLTTAVQLSYFCLCF